MSILKYFSVILVGLTATVCQAEIAIEVPTAENTVENPSAPSDATPSEIAIKVEPLRLSIDLVGGSHIIGVPEITSITVQTSYAKMDIPLDKIESIELTDDHETASFELQNGDKLKGVLNLKPIELETIFGYVSVDVQHVRSIRIRSGCMGMQGVVLHYSFDRDGGNMVSDRSEEGNHGTVHNSKWISTGRVGGAYEFAGPAQYIGVEDDRSMHLPAEMSIAAWVKVTRTGHGGVICAKGHGGGGESWLLDINAGSFRYVRRQQDGASYVHATSTQKIQFGIWYHVVGIADGKRLRIAVNATETIGQAYSGPFDTNDHKVSIGSRQGSQGAYDMYLHGTIDEVMIFNRPLSAREIKKMYDSRD